MTDMPRPRTWWERTDAANAASTDDQRRDGMVAAYAERYAQRDLPYGHRTPPLAMMSDDERRTVELQAECDALVIEIEHREATGFSTSGLIARLEALEASIPDPDPADRWESGWDWSCNRAKHEAAGRTRAVWS